MIAAPVGFQCPECVRGAARHAAPVQTAFGGRPIGRPTVTYTLIGITAAAFVLQLLVGGNTLVESFGMWPAGIALQGEWYRLLTAAFLHLSILHIAFNMYVLFALGPTLERVLGHSRFLSLYLLSALGGSIASYTFSDVQTLSVGASGAIFGLMGAMVVAGRRLRYDITQVLVLIGINVAIGFIGGAIDWRAHFGGLVVGALVAAVYAHAPRRHRAGWQLTGIAAIVIALVFLAAWRTTNLTELFAPLVVTT